MVGRSGIVVGPVRIVDGPGAPRSALTMTPTARDGANVTPR